MNFKLSITPVNMSYLYLWLLSQCVHLAISFKKVEDTDRFLILTLPRYFGAPDEDVYEFPMVSEDWLQNLGIIETCGVDYNIF